MGKFLFIIIATSIALVPGTAVFVTHIRFNDRRRRDRNHHTRLVRDRSGRALSWRRRRCSCECVPCITRHNWTYSACRSIIISGRSAY